MVNLEPIPPQPGSPGDRRHFVGRELTTRFAEQCLSEGTNLKLTDPRRMGKSSWIEYFCATTTAFTPVYIDYQGVRTVEEFLTRTGEKLGREQGLPDRARSALRGFFDNLGIEEIEAGPVKVTVGVAGLSAPELLRNTLLAVNEHAADRRPVLVCMDEVPWAIRNITGREGAEAACELLQTLRALRGEARRIRWILCGSIGFHHVLRRCGATVGEINDLGNLPLGPLEGAEATELAHRLLLGAGREPQGVSVSTLVRECGGIPFLMHKVASLLRVQGSGPVDAEQVSVAFEEFIDDRDESHAVTHLLERLDLNYGDAADRAGRVLDVLAVDGAMGRGSLAEKVGDDPSGLRGTVDLLIDDHYLRDHGNELAWRYDVLRRVWVRRRHLGGS